VKWINAYNPIDDEELLLKGQSIIRGVYIEVSNEYKIDRRELVPLKAVGWHKTTHNHVTVHINSGGCQWCQGFTRFRSRYPAPIESVSSLQEQDTTSESMKK